MARDFFQWLSDTDRLRISFEVKKGKVIRLVVQYEALIDDKWQPIARYDTAHGYLHKDLYVHGQEERMAKEPIAVADLNQGLNEAIEDLEKHWMDYKKRFMEEIQ